MIKKKCSNKILRLDYSTTIITVFFCHESVNVPRAVVSALPGFPKLIKTV